jgi:glucan 1,3-beta-glucosidase
MHTLPLSLFFFVFAGQEAALALPHHRIRGVNLGGWLVLERWIKPSLFREGWDNDGWVFSEYNTYDGVSADEWSFCKLQGKEKCSERLVKHWDTWVTEDNIQTLAEAGINHVRVPVGFWIMGDIQDDEQYVTGTTPGEEGSSLYYLTRVCDWARKYGIQVWIDLHGAPGSQNGFDNSGHLSNITWPNKRSNIERSVKVLEQLAQHFATKGYGDVMTGIGLLNEPGPAPLGPSIEILTDFYTDAFRATRTHLPDVNLFIADRFWPKDW